MARTDSTKLATLIALDSLVSSDAAILTANELVTEKCNDSGYSESRLELIERYLAAHFYAIRVKQTKSEKVDVITVNYIGVTGMGLNYTPWGQTAMQLDTAGSLRNLNNGYSSSEIGITYLGNMSTDQLNEISDD